MFFRKRSPKLIKDSKTHYQRLGVSYLSSQEEIKNAYRELVRKVHPDIFFHSEPLASNKLRNDAFVEFQEAYRILVDPQRRAQYDTEMREAYIYQKRIESKRRLFNWLTYPIQRSYRWISTKFLHSNNGTQQAKAAGVKVLLLESQKVPEHVEQRLPFYLDLLGVEPGEVIQLHNPGTLTFQHVSFKNLVKTLPRYASIQRVSLVRMLYLSVNRPSKLIVSIEANSGILAQDTLDSLQSILPDFNLAEECLVIKIDNLVNDVFAATLMSRQFLIYDAQRRANPDLTLARKQVVGV